jgi:hypothetical protein
MAYIKANKKVVEYLNLIGVRNQLRDGNYLLWQADMLAFGKPTQMNDILQQIGGLSLSRHEAREEQDGEKLRTLPEATDVRFKVEATVQEEEVPIEEAPPVEAAEPEQEEADKEETPVLEENTETAEEEAANSTQEETTENAEPQEETTENAEPQEEAVSDAADDEAAPSSEEPAHDETVEKEETYE